MPPVPPTTRVFLSIHHTPSGVLRAACYSILRGGHTAAGPEWRYERESLPGHEIILCLKGKGYVRQRGKTQEVKAGEAVWVNLHHPHAYWADARHPWEYYWVRFEGPQLDALFKMLLELGGPVVEASEDRRKQDSFRRLFELAGTESLNFALHVHAEIARLIALVFDRFPEMEGTSVPELPPGLRGVIDRMRQEHHLPLRITDLARTAGMSPSHFIRSFRRATGTSPIDWLRRERLSQAQRRLVETDDSLKEIARQVGYADQFYFSRDFKRATSLSPSEYRRKERGDATEKSS